MTSEHMRRLRVAFMSSLICLVCLLAACAGPLAIKPLVPSPVSSMDAQTPNPGPTSQENAFRAGRFSLVIDTEPVQSFIASFELAGAWPDGVLAIYNPLGMQMARVEWTPQGARLIQGSQIRQAVSLESLIFQLTGTQLPAAALIDWLGGKPTPAEGWKVDVSEWHLRRLVLERIQPAPRTVLRIAFES